ncbi:MAG: hypothetical protein IJD49_00860 [Clostridia bacterium]|nr:hypothetical protein [Clostridia bacterium]
MKKIISVFLCFAMMFSMLAISASAFTAGGECNEGDCEYYPTIIIPGLGQSNVLALDDNGEFIVDSDGNKTAAFPGVMDIGAIIKTAIVPLLLSAVTQSDIGFSDAVADVINVIFGINKCDNKAQPSKNVFVEKYPYSLADCTEEEKAAPYHHVPLDEFESCYPEDHLYYFSYNSFGNHIDTANELYDFIHMVMEQTGHDKVIISPISQGGSLANALFEYHPDIMDCLAKVLYIVPCLDGSTIIGDAFNDRIRFLDPEVLYDGFLSTFFDVETASMIETVLRILPDEVIMKGLEKGVEVLVNDIMTMSTSMWAMCPSGDYLSAAEKYLSTPERASIKEQTYKYYQAQLHSDENIQKLIDKGVEVLNVAEYDIQMYGVGYSFDKENADGIIQLDSTSMGAYAANVGETLPEGYVQQNTSKNCSDPSHNHISPDRVVDASTAMLPDTTFYFDGQKHEQTALNSTILKLALKILENKITDVYSDPDFPQFTTCAPYPAPEEGFFTKLSDWLFDNYGSNGFSEMPAITVTKAVTFVASAIKGLFE